MISYYRRLVMYCVCGCGHVVVWPTHPFAEINRTKCKMCCRLPSPSLDYYDALTANADQRASSGDADERHNAMPQNEFQVMNKYIQVDNVSAGV